MSKLKQLQVPRQYTHHKELKDLVILPVTMPVGKHWTQYALSYILHEQQLAILQINPNPNGSNTTHMRPVASEKRHKQYTKLLSTEGQLIAKRADMLLESVGFTCVSFHQRPDHHLKVEWCNTEHQVTFNFATNGTVVSDTDDDGI